MTNPSSDPAGPCTSSTETSPGVLGIVTTFTWTCPFGCAVDVVDGHEQRHDCLGERLIIRGVSAYIADEGDRRVVARAIAERLKPVLRERAFEAWRDGVRAGRRGPCYGVDDFPDAPPDRAGDIDVEPGIGRLGVGTTTDPDHPDITYGVDDVPTPQARVYLVKAAGRLHRPVRTAYRHVGTIIPAARGCGAVTTIALAIAETYAREPGFYQATYCTGCRMHRPVAEFEWVPRPGEDIPVDQRRVGS